MSIEDKAPIFITRDLELDFEPVRRQVRFHNAAPLDDGDHLRVMQVLSELIAYRAGLTQTVEIVVMDLKRGEFVYLTERERRTGDVATVAKTTS